MTLFLRRLFLFALCASCLGGLPACATDRSLATQPADSDAETVWGSSTRSGTKPINGPAQNEADFRPGR